MLELRRPRTRTPLSLQAARDASSQLTKARTRQARAGASRKALTRLPAGRFLAPDVTAHARRGRTPAREVESQPAVTMTERARKTAGRRVGKDGQPVATTAGTAGWRGRR